MIQGGYVLLARKIIESELMNKPPHYMKLWVWMLGRAFWKDGDQIKRGQFLTTISEMQDAGGYYVGARKKQLTRDEVRSCYEAFSKATMITTAKTTRGMVITICNYDIYQDVSNYEGHTEPHGENTSKATGTPHDRERKNKEGIKKESKIISPPQPGEVASLAFSEAVMWISEELARLILVNNPKHRDLQEDKRGATVLRWAKDIDKLLRIDGREPREVAGVVRWCQRDPFWSMNILSGRTLREKYDRLVMQMKGNPAQLRTASRSKTENNIDAAVQGAKLLGIVDHEEQ